MAPLSTYPASDLDRPDVLAGLLGTFWSSIYAAAPELDASLRGLGSAYRQCARDLGEVLASVAYADTPLRHVEEWTPVALRESDASNPAFALPRYGDPSGSTYGDAGLYGIPSRLARFPVSIAPADDVLLIADAVVGPKVVLAAGLDFTVDVPNRMAWLEADPFANPGLTPVPLFDARGVQVDRALDLWLWRAAADRRLLRDRVGSVLGLDVPSTRAGRDLVVAVLDALVRGTSELAVRRLFSALYDVPLAGSDGEVVAAIAVDAAGLFIATDAAVYRFAAAATPVVAPGQVLAAGDPLVDALRFDSLASGRVPSGLRGLALGPALLGGAYETGLAWADARAPLRVAPATTDPSFLPIDTWRASVEGVGRLLLEDGESAALHEADAAGTVAALCVSWPLGRDDDDDTRRFWADVCARGRTPGPDLARVLDVRGRDPAGPTRAINLPASVNPLQFLAANVLRGGTYLVRVRAAGCGPGRLDALAGPLLRRVVPPHVLLLVQLLMPAILDNGAGPPAGDGLPGLTLGLPTLADPGGWTPPADDRIHLVEAGRWDD